MKIRRAKLEDSAEIARLHRGTIRTINKNDYSPQQIEVWSKRSNAKRFSGSHNKVNRYVAVEDDRIVGFSDFEKENPENFGGLYVHKDYVGKGIGTRLITTMEKKAKRLGAMKFRLDATKTAKEFYLKRGFTVVKKSKHHIGDEKLEIYIMEKKF